MKFSSSMKDHSYQPQPAKRKYIAKKNSGKKRPLGIPSTDDKLVQEVVRVMLEAIYEPGFSVHSHGFRPNRSCHTCLTEVKRTFTGVKWFVEGDIKGCFDLAILMPSSVFPSVPAVMLPSEDAIF